MAIPSAFSWQDITVNLLGKVLVHFKEITYRRRDDKQNNYGAGRKAVSRGRGNITPEVTMRLNMEELVGIRNALAPGQSICDIAPFDIPVVYSNDDGVLVTDVIEDFEFTEDMGGGNQNDMELVMTVPGICSDVDWGQSL